MKKNLILIVEDDQLYADKLKMDLAEEGYTNVFVAHTSQDAINFADKKSPELIIMDIQLIGSERNGILTAQHIQKFLEVPVIYLTDLGDERFNTKNTKHSSFLEKPVFRHNLLHRVEEGLDASSFLQKQHLLDEHISINHNGFKHKIKIATIEWAQSQKNHCDIQTETAFYRKVSCSLGDLEKQLKEYPFIERIHREYLVNTNKVFIHNGSNTIVMKQIENMNIQEVIKHNGRNFYLEKKKEIPVARKIAKLFFKRLWR